VEKRIVSHRLVLQLNRADSQSHRAQILFKATAPRTADGRIAARPDGAYGSVSILASSAASQRLAGSARDEGIAAFTLT